ncbi:MAG: hypothetical protein WCA31_00245 [Acidimicrobiales bacterium]
MSEHDIEAEYNDLLGEVRSLPDHCPDDRIFLIELLEGICARASRLQQMISGQS